MRRFGRISAVWGRQIRVVVPESPRPLGHIPAERQHLYHGTIQTQWIDTYPSNAEFALGQWVEVLFDRNDDAKRVIATD